MEANQKTEQQARRWQMEMANRAALRSYGRYPGYSEMSPSDAFDFNRSIPNGRRTVVGRDQPRWFGHDLSEVPDSGIGHSGNARTRDDGVGWFGQSTFRPTLPQPTRRKRRAGGRVVTVSDVGMDIRNEGAMWGMPRKRALFSPEGQDSVLSVVSVMTWWHAYRRKWRSSGRRWDIVARGSLWAAKQAKTSKSDRRSRNDTVGLEIETSGLEFETYGLEIYTKVSNSDRRSRNETSGLEIYTVGLEIRP